MKLLANRLKDADFIRTVWHATPEPGITLEEMMKPEWWTHVARMLKKGDHIEVTSEDGEWFAELLVRSTTDKGVCVFALRSVVFSEDKPAAADAIFEVKHRGGAGWSVVRRSDKVVVYEKGATRADAEAWVKASSSLD